MIALVLWLLFITSCENVTYNCPESGWCSQTDLNCLNNEDCIYNCNSKDSCKQSTINAINARDGNDIHFCIIFIFFVIKHIHTLILI